MNAHLKYANRKMFEIGTTLMIAASLLGVLFFAGMCSAVLWYAGN